MNRRDFTSLLPALYAGVALLPQTAEGKENLPMLKSGVIPAPPFSPGTQAGHASSRYGMGMLKAGNIRLEMHESTIQPGAEHEAVGAHLHSEIWLVREGTADLVTNGVSQKMVAGDVGICIAGDKHYITNTSNAPVTYFVVTVGPPE